MNILKIKSTLCLVVISIVATSVNASVIYQYTGNQYTDFFLDETDLYDSSMSITGFIEFENPLAPNLSVNGDEYGNVTPISYSFFDGINTFTNLSPPTFEEFDIGTDSFGNITSWYIELWDTYPSPVSINDTKGFMYIVGDDYYPGWAGFDQGSLSTCDELSNGTSGVYCSAQTQKSGWNDTAGTWSVSTSAVPIPAAAWLFISGLLGLTVASRRKHSA